MRIKISIMYFLSFILVFILSGSIFILNNENQINKILGYENESVDSEIKNRVFYNNSQNLPKFIEEKNKLLVDLVTNNLIDKISELASLLEFTGNLNSVKNLSSLDTLNDTIGTLHGISDKQDIDKRNIAKSILLKFDEFQAISFILPNGDIYLAEPYERQLNAKSTNFSFRDYFQVAKETQSTYLSDIFTSSSAKLEQSAISVPLFSQDDSLIGIWSGLLNFSSINESLLNLNLTNERFIILDEYGNKMTDSQKDDSDQILYTHLISLINNNKEQKINTLITKINEKLIFVLYKSIDLYGNSRTLFLLEPLDGILPSSSNQYDSDIIKNYSDIYLEKSTNLVNSNDVNSNNTMNIGALINLDGSLASLGEYQIKSIEFAVHDFNKHILGKNDSSSIKNLEVLLENTDTNPVVALEKIKSLYYDNIKIIVGPVTSSELEIC